MPAQTTSIPFTSYSDLIEHALDYLGGTADNQALRDCMRSTIQSYRDVTNARTWTYLLTHGRIVTDPPSTTGQVSFTRAGMTVGGTSYPRVLTLTGGVWPTPVLGGTIGGGWQVLVGTATSQVETYIDPTHVTISQDVGPGADFGATSYTLYHDEYLLPTDFIKGDTPIYEGNFGGLEYRDFTEALWWQRFVFSAGTPRHYNITGSRLFPGRMIIRLYPYPTTSRTIDFVYQRRPRDLVLQELSQGSVTVTAGSPLVAANGFTVPAGCVGALFRLGTPQESPTSWLGINPPAFETHVDAVLDPQTLRTVDPAPTSGNLKYLLSDPIDVEQQSMIQPVLRGIEKYLQFSRNIQGKPDSAIAYEVALKAAEAADSRSYQGRAMGAGRGRSAPWKYFPANFWPSSS